MFGLELRGTSLQGAKLRRPTLQPKIDDEVPATDWLEQLLLIQARTAADVVRGPVTPVFAAAAPAWIRDGHFFG